MPEHRFEPQAFGKYLLTERIGAGGMAEIFRATAFGVEGFTKEICIKRILPTLTDDETFVKMFIDEAKIAVTLHHANVVQVFDLGRIGEHYFIAMELVRGRDLLQIINRCRTTKQRMPVPITLYLLAEVCKGLDYAHRVKSEGRPMGIIHRDVSPSNILVSWEGEVKVADFGIAKATHKDERTATGTLKGKYGYMSPEQVRGEAIDHRSDIFAAGILLYESLVGKRLFKGETDLETLEKVRAAEISYPPSVLNKKVPLEVDQIVSKALARNPVDRYQTAGELHDALVDRLFATLQRVNSKTLSHFIQQLFPEEIKQEEEREKERSHSGVTPPPFAWLPATGPAPGAPTSTPVPERRPLSSLAIGVLVTGSILIAAAAVVLIFWYQSKPAPSSQVVSPSRVLAPAPSATGTLSVSSRPEGASIHLAGQPVGLTTPALIRDLDRTKTHTVRLTLKDHQPWSKNIDFGKMEMVALDAQLIPLPANLPPYPPPPPKPAFGTLNINAVPVWAYVYIDGKKQARPTPIYNLKLRPGIYEIRLENPKLKLVKIQKVTIQKGKPVDLVVKMK